MKEDKIINILVVDDEKSIRRLLQKELGNHRRNILSAGSAGEAMDLLRRLRFDIVILDIRLPDGDGMQLMESFQKILPELQVILITGHGDIDHAVTAMKNGAYDYITKPFELDRLEMVVEKAFQRVCLQRENRLLRHTRKDDDGERMVGSSRAMQSVRYLVGKVAPTHVPVLITGESGTGKNVIARAIHKRSLRADQPLLTKNCGTLQKDLMRSELFGYTKGAFTGAEKSTDGLLALAHNGTLFLDEIGELSNEVQSALLRVMENQTYRRVGDKEERQVDIRFLFATNRDLKEEVAEGRFSEALFHRLNVFNVKSVPLRERKEEITDLVDHFLLRFASGDTPCRVSPGAMASLMRYDWPGNVRELQNVIERGTILAEDGLITEAALPLELAGEPVENDLPAPGLALKDVEAAHIRRVLSHAGGSRTEAAKLLGIGRKTLYRKLKELDIQES